MGIRKFQSLGFLVIWVKEFLVTMEMRRMGGGVLKDGWHLLTPLWGGSLVGMGAERWRIKTASFFALRGGNLVTIF